MVTLKPFDPAAYRCPRCDVPFVSGHPILPGMRNLLDAHCGACGANFYMDLPAGHALYWPVALDQGTGELFANPPLAWLTRPLVAGAATPQVQEVPIRFVRATRHPRIVLVNCLDFLFGHCLLKLLNAQYILDHYPELACCVLLPKMLAHLVPEEVAEVWEVDLPLREQMGWFASIERQLRSEIDARDQCYLAPAPAHPNPSAYDLRRFTKVEPMPRGGPGSPVRIVYAYREDRLWGTSLAAQQLNILRLRTELGRVFTNIEFVLAGFGTAGVYGAEILDVRANRSTPEREQQWLRLYADADCVIGVHGSNMLLPSGMARHVVELLPQDRIGNITQDILWPTDTYRANDALFRVRFLTGRPDLSDVKATTVAATVAYQVSGQETYDLLSGGIHAAAPEDITPLAQIGARVTPPYLATISHIHPDAPDNTGRLKGLMRMVKRRWARLQVYVLQRQERTRGRIARRSSP